MQFNVPAVADVFCVADVSPVANVPAVSGDPGVVVVFAFAEVLIKQTIRL
jgi:hypothetical protein